MAEVAIPYTLETPAGDIEFVLDGDGLRLYDIAGMDGAAVRSAVENIPQGDGAILFEFFRGARFPVLSGIIKYTSSGVPATDYVNRRVAEDELRARTNSILNAYGTLRFTPHGASERQLQVRLLDTLQIRSQEGILKEFQIALIADDPLVYGATEHSQDTAAITEGEGGWSFPTGFPFSFGEATTGGSATVTNAGTAETFPIIRIYGPAASPTVRNVTTGYSLSFFDLTLAEGDYVEVDCREQTVLFNGSELVSLQGNLDPVTSEFFTLVTGDNVIQLLGGTVGSAAHATIVWRDAYI